MYPLTNGIKNDALVNGYTECTSLSDYNKPWSPCEPDKE